MLSHVGFLQSLGISVPAQSILEVHVGALQILFGAVPQQYWPDGQGVVMSSTQPVTQTPLEHI
jgi:hypothetical protein